MINTFMAVWNQQRRRRGMILFLTFLVICISVSLLLVTLGDPVWLYLLKAAKPPSQVDGAHIVNTPVNNVTAVPTSPITPTATATAQGCNSTPTSTIRATPAKIKNRVTPRATRAGTGSQGSRLWTPPVTHKYSTPTPTRRPTPRPTSIPTAFPMTPTPVVAPTSASSPTVTPTTIVTPTQEPTSTPAPVVTPTAVTTPIGTATPALSPTATATPIPSSTPIVTVVPSSTPTIPSTTTPDDDSRLGGAVVSKGQTPVKVKNNVTKSPNGTQTTRKNARLVDANCLGNSLDLLVYEGIFTTIERNIALILGGGVFGTFLFYSIIASVTRRKNIQ